MSYSISVYGHGPVDDDLRAAFNELVSALRAATPDAPGNSLGGTLSTGAATYTTVDVPEDEPADDDEEDQP